MNPAVRLLHLEDDPADRELIPATLEAAGFQVESRAVAGRDDFVAALEAGGFDVILADCRLPAFDGLEALALARERRPEIPFLFVSGFLGEEVALESLKHGATDYVFKHNLARLAPAVRRALQEARAAVERRQLEEQVRRAQRLEGIGTLAGGIAHDLNNVLAPLLMSLRLFRSRLTAPEDLEILDAIEASARRGADIVRQVLAFARGQPGARVPVDLPAIAAEVGRMIRETFPPSIRLEMDIAPALRPALGDATQIYQVLMNLCVNARDAMPGGGRLEVRLENAPPETRAPGAPAIPDPAGFVRITVADTGAGIPSGDLAKIFDPFFTTKPTGTGLGLSTSLALVQGHGGWIRVTSEPGQGTRFEVHLPAAPAGTPAAGTGATGNAGIPRGRGERILVVDDDPAVSRICQAALEAHGYRVATAANSDEAQRWLDQHGPEAALVLTDLRMPGLDGVPWLERLRERHPSVPLLVMSGLPGVQPEGMEIPVLAKPVTAERLLGAVQERLAAQPAAPRPPSNSGHGA